MKQTRDAVIQAQLDAAEKKSEELIDLLLSKFAVMDEDMISVIYDMWLYFIHYLAEAGYTEKDMVKDVKTHVKIHNEN